MKNIKRVLAGVLGIGIIIGLLALYDGINGDPFSEANAKKQAVKYARELYPGQTFTAKWALYDSPFTYRVNVQSQESPDTHFDVVTRWWLSLSDTLSPDEEPEHQRLVENGWNTCVRLNNEASALASEIFQNQWPELGLLPIYGVDAHTVNIDLSPSPFLAAEEQDRIMAIYKEKWFDQSFDTVLLENAPASLEMQVSWNAIPTEDDAAEILCKAKEIMEANGMPMAYYEVILIPSDALGLDDAKEYMLDSKAIAAEDILSPAAALP